MSSPSPARPMASRDVPDLPGDNALPRWLAEHAATRSPTCAAAGAWRRHRRAARRRPDRRAWAAPATAPSTSARCAAALAAVRARGRRPARRAARGRPDVRGDAGLARAPHGLADAGPRRGARAADGRRRPATGPPRSSARSSIGTARALGAHWRRWPTRRSSIRGSSSPTGSAPTRRAGRGPRTASPRTCCSRTHRRPVAADADGRRPRDAPIPVLLGGHTLVGPGIGSSSRRAAARRWT